MDAIIFYVPKKNGSYSDALMAVGLGKMLSILSDEEEVTIEEHPGFFQLKMNSGVDLEELDYEELQLNPGYRYIKFTENEDAPPDSYPYNKHQELYRAERERRKRSRKPEELFTEAEENTQAPSQDYLLIQSLRVLQGLGTSNSLYRAIQDADTHTFKATVQARLQIFLSPIPQERPKKEPFKPKVSAVQAYNPIIGKGVNRPKADSVSLASIPNVFVDWFEEWLKFIGATIVLNAYPVGDDLKFTVLVPKEFEIGKLSREVRNSFLTYRYWSSIKTDVLVALDVVNFLVQHSEEFIMQSRQPRRRTPRDLISGLYTAYFKSLGSGRALINHSFIALPDWFPIETKEDANLWLKLVLDHKQVLNFLDEDKNEEFSLLNQYRDFLSGSEWILFLKYLAQYASLYMQKKERKQPVRQHGLPEMKGVLTKVSTVYEEMLNNEGFQEIAKAIREATVREQYRKSINNQQFKIHYGLFQELKRKAQFREQALASLSDFINEYNTETMRKMEVKGGSYKGRQLIPASALNKFIELYDKYDKQHESIILLLIAYASTYDDSYQKQDG